MDNDEPPATLLVLAFDDLQNQINRRAHIFTETTLRNPNTVLLGLDEAALCRDFARLKHIRMMKGSMEADPSTGDMTLLMGMKVIHTDECSLIEPCFLPLRPGS